ncbi:hypothetical protein D9M71_664700 [compost metagenome]
MGGNFFDLQGHEAVVDGGNVVVGRRTAEDFGVTLADLRLVAQGADVVPLAHAHWAACFLDRNLYVEFTEGLDENLRWGEGAEIDDSAGPVEDGSLQFAWIVVVHFYVPL